MSRGAEEWSSFPSRGKLKYACQQTGEWRLMAKLQMFNVPLDTFSLSRIPAFLLFWWASLLGSKLFEEKDALYDT